MNLTLRLLAVVLAVLTTRFSSANQPPNVVLIISDDQAWTDYSYEGHEAIQTPHIDKLVSESAFFPRTYLPASVCRPSLASMITGLYPHQHRITGNDVVLPKKRPKGWRRHKDKDYLAQCEELISNIDKNPTLPRLLAKKGYISHQSGKWWEGPYSRGGFTAGMTHGDPKRRGRHGDEGLKIGRTGMKPIFDFIDGANGKPFFIWYAPFLPHTPHNPPKRLLDKYKKEGRPLQLAKYWAMCEWFDETCGELLDGIKKRDLEKNTLVIYVTDNGWIQRTKNTKVPKGWYTGYAPRSKQSPFDGGARTPMMLRWPGVIKPGKREELVTSLDIAPTVLAAAGLEKTKAMEGIDLLPVCKGGKVPTRDMFGELSAHDIADIHRPEKSLLYRWCVSGRYKLIRNYPGVLHRYKNILTPTEKFPQLYDVFADPHEQRDLAGSMPDKVAELSAKLDALWKPGAP